MNKLSEENMAIAAALLVLFTAMLSPIVSAILAFSFLLLYAIYRWRRSGDESSSRKRQ